MLAEDMSVFFDTTPGSGPADLFVLLDQQGEPAAEFPGILGVVSKGALDGNAIGPVRELRYPTAAVMLRDGNTIVRQLPGGVTEIYRLRGDPELENDGAESLVRLGRVKAP